MRHEIHDASENMSFPTCRLSVAAMMDWTDLRYIVNGGGKTSHGAAQKSTTSGIE